MITCVAISKTKVVVKISGRTFEEDLDRFKLDVPSNKRIFDGTKFIVRDAQFSKVPYIVRALQDFSKQTPLL